MKKVTTKKPEYKVENRGIVKTSEGYVLIEEILLTNELKQHIKSTNKLFYKMYSKSKYIYMDANKDEIVDIEKYYGCKFINTRNIDSIEFLESDFFKKNHTSIIMAIMYAFNEKNLFDLNNRKDYELLKSREFLTSDFAKKNYEIIFNTLNDIITARENSKKDDKGRSKILERN